MLKAAKNSKFQGIWVKLEIKLCFKRQILKTFFLLLTSLKNQANSKNDYILVEKSKNCSYILSGCNLNRSQYQICT